jgi:hypothetical protein
MLYFSIYTLCILCSGMFLLDVKVHKVAATYTAPIPMSQSLRVSLWESDFESQSLGVSLRVSIFESQSLGVSL